MHVNETPFRAGWLGQGLDDVRPDVGTYGRYPHQDLPPLPFELRGDFEWLSGQPPRTDNIARERPPRMQRLFWRYRATRLVEV
jgi:hypothetical protein